MHLDHTLIKLYTHRWSEIENSAVVQGQREKKIICLFYNRKRQNSEKNQN